MSSVRIGSCDQPRGNSVRTLQRSSCEWSDCRVNIFNWYESITSTYNMYKGRNKNVFKYPREVSITPGMEHNWKRVYIGYWVGWRREVTYVRHVWKMPARTILLTSNSQRDHIGLLLRRFKFNKTMYSCSCHRVISLYPCKHKPVTFSTW